MSVEMNYPMVQYLRKALKNEKAAVQELNRLLGFPNSISPDCDKSDSYLQVEKSIGMFCKLRGYGEIKALLLLGDDTFTKTHKKDCGLSYFREVY